MSVRAPLEPGGSVTWAIEQPDVELFNSAYRKDILTRIFALRGAWTERGAATFHTLGCALYQDAQPPERLAEHVAASNSLLREHFGDVLEQVRRFIASVGGGSARWHDELPLPGFHIFGHGAIPVGRSGSGVHFDAQFQLVGMPRETPDRILSLTLPVLLPGGGGSLDYWPLDADGVETLFRTGAIQDIEEIETLYPTRQIWYAEGRPCLQRGLPLHRVGASRFVRRGEYRITLQCHALRSGAEWIVYW